MKRSKMISAALCLSACLAAAQEPEPLMVNYLPTSLSGVWLFRTGHDPAWSSPFRERRNWQAIRVPGAWEGQGYAGLDGHAWYLLSFFVSSQLAGEELGISLGVIGDADEVFLNGQIVGTTGAPPPRAQMAPYARRFYALPREAVRFGEYNELAIHVFNQVRWGGLLGPPPFIDSYERILSKQVVRDLLAYSLVALLATLAVFHLALFVVQRRSLEHLAFASFLLFTGSYFLTYAHWGPVLILGHNLTLRLNLTSLLLAIGLFPIAVFSVARRRLPVSVMILQGAVALGAAVCLVWRREADLYLLVHIAEVSLVVLSVIVLRVILSLARQRHPLGWGLLGATALCLVLMIVDILVDLGALPRVWVGPGELFAPLGLVPLALILSLALAYSWVERRWGEPVELATGLISGERFAELLTRELQRSRRNGHPLTVALLRLESQKGGSERNGERVAAVGVLRRALRQIDLLARYDADTFAILLVDTEERAAMTALERLRRAVAESGSSATARLRCTAGVAQYRASRHDGTQELLGEAEAALYAALNEGGGSTATAP